MRSTRWLAGVFGSVLLVSAARAEESEAEGMFQEGRALMLEGRFEEACPKLELSQQLEPKVGTMLNLAVCHERLGMIASAWVEFQQARDAATAEGREEQRRLAQERIDVLGPRVPWLTVKVPPAIRVEGLAVALDGAPVDDAEWGAPMPIDPGEHVLVAAAPGHEPRQLRFTIAVSSRKTVTVAALVPLEPEPTPEPRARRRPRRPTEAPAPAEPPPFQRWVLEAALFGGYLLVDGDRVSPEVSPEAIALSDGTNAASCGWVSCDYTLGPRGGAILGLSVFAGYAATDWFHVGGRIAVGPRVGGGVWVASGPSVLFRVAGPLSLGLGVALGAASAEGDGEVVAYPPYFTTSTERVPMSANVELAGGPMAELSVRLVDTEHGSLVLNTTPMVMFGVGTAVAVPFGLGFRFQ